LCLSIGLPTNEVRDFWLTALGLELIDEVLQRATSLRHTFVLAQMFQPGLHKKGLHHPTLAGRVLEDAPAIGAIAPTLDKIVFRKLNLANSGRVPVGPNAVIEDDIGFTRSA
jgi:hypothetical protein